MTSAVRLVFKKPDPWPAGTMAPPHNLSKEASRIRQMFADISRRYDFLNHFLSLNIDRLWRRRAARDLEIRPGDRLLDVCTGTGDLALELAKHVDGNQGGHVHGVDFCYEMVALGESKRRRRHEKRLSLLAGDCISLPFPDGTFDGVTVAFGIRNVCDLTAALSELRRVLKNGGRLAILEFTTPRRALIRKLYLFYFHRVLPGLGKWLSGHRRGGEAYSYLPASVREFPGPDAFSRLLSDNGFERVRYSLLTGGVVQLHLASLAPGGPEPMAERAEAGRREEAIRGEA